MWGKKNYPFNFRIPFCLSGGLCLGDEVSQIPSGAYVQSESQGRTADQALLLPPLWLSRPSQPTSTHSKMAHCDLAPSPGGLSALAQQLNHRQDGVVEQLLTLKSCKWEAMEEPKGTYGCSSLAEVQSTEARSLSIRRPLCCPQSRKLKGAGVIQAY